MKQFEENLKNNIAKISAGKGGVILAADIFDTVLVRKVQRPSDIFILLENKAKAKFNFQSGMLTSLRKRGEREARLDASILGKKEITLDDIYHKIGAISGLSRKDLDEIKHLEIDIEISCIDVRSEVLDVIQRFSGEIKELILVSDTYFSMETIVSMLKKSGFEKRMGKYRVYLSSIEGVTKHDGELLPVVIEKNKLDPSSVIFIGDNIKSDICNSNKGMVRAVHIPKISYFADVEGLSFRSSTNRCAHSAALSGLINKHLSESESLPVAQKAANSYAYALAPLWSGFMAWMLRSIKERSIEKIYFFSRDGFVFHKLSGALNLDSEYSYAYISREVLYRIYFYVDYESACAYISQNYTDHTLDAAISRLFDSNEVIENVRSEVLKAGFILEKNVSAQQSSLMLVVKLFKDELQVQGKHRLKNYLAYLKDIGFLDSKKVAIVDLGWHGSLQRILKDVLDYSGYSIELNGYYLGLFSGASKDTYGSYFNGYLCDRSRQEENLESQVKASPSLIEILHSAPHGSTSNVDENRTPVFRAHDVLPDAIELVKSIQDLAIELVVQSLDVSSISLEENSLTPSESFKCLYNIMESPTKEHVLLAKNFTLSPDYGISNPINIMSPINKDLEASHWVSGTVRLLAMIEGEKSPEWFDDLSYLKNNPDVARAIIKGMISSAYSHYATHGKYESRKNSL